MTLWRGSQEEHPMTSAQLRQRFENAHIPVATMAAVLATSDTDLGDERAIIRDLRQAGFSHGDILAGMDEAIEIAREMECER
jgi:hypothetical protein